MLLSCIHNTSRKLFYFLVGSETSAGIKDLSKEEVLHEDLTYSTSQGQQLCKRK